MNAKNKITKVRYIVIVLSAILYTMLSYKTDFGGILDRPCFPSDNLLEVSWRWATFLLVILLISHLIRYIYTNWNKKL